MAMGDNELNKQIQLARIASFGAEASIRTIPLPHGVEAINFADGEIASITLADGRTLKRGMVVKVSSRYVDEGIAVIVSFVFGKTQLPVVISMGGAEGELTACMRPQEIGLFQKQRDMGRAVTLQAA